MMCDIQIDDRIKPIIQDTYIRMAREREKRKPKPAATRGRSSDGKRRCEQCGNRYEKQYMRRVFWRQGYKYACPGCYETMLVRRHRKGPDVETISHEEAC